MSDPEEKLAPLAPPISVDPNYRPTEGIDYSKISEYPTKGDPGGDPALVLAKPRFIPEMVKTEMVQWAVNRPAPTDLQEQEEVMAILFWYLPEETMYAEVRERWGWGVLEVQEIVDRPSFYICMGKAMKPLLLKTYTKIMLVMADRAERGHLGAANFLFQETGMKREQRIEEAEKENLEAVVAKLIKAVQDVLPNQDIGRLDVHSKPGWVPRAVLPASFNALPEPARRERLVKTKVYKRRVRKPD